MLASKRTFTRHFAMLATAASALFVATSAIAASQPNSGGSPYVVAEYMRAVPAGPSDASAPARQCKRICVRAGKGTPTHEAPCLQWKTVC
jgi:hypothetical protein